MTKTLEAWRDFAKFSWGHSDFPAPNGGSPFMRRMFHVLHGHDPFDALTVIVDRSVAAIVILAVILDIFLAGQVPVENVHPLLTTLDWFSTIVLTIEFLGRCALIRLDPRLAGQPSKAFRFLLRPMSLLDLLVLIPSWLSLFGILDLGLMRLIRLLRLVEMAHVVMPKWNAFLRDSEGKTARQRTSVAMFGDVRSFGIPALVDLLILCMIILSVVLITLESVLSLQMRYHSEFQVLDLMVTFVFAAEYLLRLYCCVEDPRYSSPLVGRLRYALTWGAIVDLLAILPLLLAVFALADIRALWMLRLLRMLKLSRYSPSFASICEVVREERPILVAAFLMLTLVTIFAACGVYVVENPSQPEKFSSIPAAMYWAVVTLTTIGYGDVYPITPIGQMLTMVLAVAGLGMIALPAGILATGFSEKIRDASREKAYRKATLKRTAVDQPHVAAEVYVPAEITVDQILRSTNARKQLSAIIDPMSKAEREAMLALIALSLSDHTDD